MSGIVGIVRRDGVETGQSEVASMLSSIAHRGPDRQALWFDGPAAFGHAMLCTTPESLHEQLPWTHPESGLSITSDARIDNRDELISALRAEPACSDSQLILHAYRKWGAACPSKLVGDFAFAIWDKRRREVFCARDPMGVKCLYYFVSGNLFAFASEIKALCRLPEIPARLNELRVLDYLANLFDDREITFYRDIYRLPAASSLSITPEKVRQEKYWILDDKKELKLSSDEEYAEAFRECFLNSVKTRMRSAYPVGAALSGGLDSSSIACAARNFNSFAGVKEPLKTYSLTFPSVPETFLGQIDERNYMDDVLKQGGFQPTYLRADECSPLKDVARVQNCLDEAFFQGNLYLHWAMFHCAGSQGVRIFLDGTDGDTTVSHGFEYLADLVTAGRWLTLRDEVHLVARQMGANPGRIFRDYCLKPFCPTWVYSAWRRAHGRPPDAGTLETFMTPEFTSRLKLDERIGAMITTSRKCFSTGREKHLAMLMFPLYAHALEASDKAAAAFGVEARFPFFDQRLIELCLSLPSGQKLSKGWNRSVLRRAMAGILPESVRWRQSKANLSPNFYLRLIDRDREVVDDVLFQNSSELEPYVDLTSIRKAYDTYLKNPLRSHQHSLNIFSAVNLGLWLRNAGVRP